MLPIPQIPYGAIGLVVALVFMALAFQEAEAGGRVVILAVLILSFLLPALFSSRTLELVCRIGRLLFGAGCYIYWKYKAAVT
jgi:hypothetical protein